MASLTIRNIDEPIEAKLRIRAAENGRSMEEEVRQILADAMTDQATRQPGDPDRGLGLAERIRRRIAPLGGIDLPKIPREPMREPPDFT